MNKAINRTLMIMVVSTLMAVIVMGCNRTNDNDEVEEFVFIENTNERYAERYEMVSLSEAGIIYEDRSGGMIHLVTIDEGEDMVLCYDPNCRHIPTTKYQPDPTCMAALFLESTHVGYYEGCIYFFVSEGIFEHKIYRMETDGAGRELIAELPFSYNIAQCSLFCGDKVYYLAKIPQVDEITSSVNYVLRMVEVDLEDGSYRFVTEETSDLTLQINMAGDTLYMRRAAATDGGVYAMKVDINTLEEEVFIPGEVWRNEYVYIDAYDEDSFFCWDKQTYEICIRNVDGTVEKVLVKGPEGESFRANPSCDGLYYERQYDYGDEPVGAYFMDFATGEVTNITDEKEKYGIVGYDGYYDVFVARDEEFNWSMWSKEKVLGEAK